MGMKPRHREAFEREMAAARELRSAAGRVPIGNTGGSDISMFRELPIEPGLAELMRE